MVILEIWFLDSTKKAQALMDSYLGDYNGLCSQNQVELTSAVVKGRSFRKFLVREAKNLAAFAVLVGITKFSPLSGRVSLAKYCAKRLPSPTEVWAIHNGKVVYSRLSNPRLSCSHGDPRPSLCFMYSHTMSVSHSDFGDSDLSDTPSLSYHFSQSFNSVGTYSTQNTRSEVLCNLQRSKSSLSSISLPVEDFTQQRPGWPLLQTASELTPPFLEARNMPVVQWVMNLPDRSLLQSWTITNSSYDDLVLLKDLERLLVLKSSSCKLFSYDILKSSVSQFAAENLISNGGCNRVYKGILPDGKPVAVKTLMSSRESWKEFSREVEIMTTLKHKNITPLLGICLKDKDLLSVYEFLAKGNLEEILHGKEKSKLVLPWKVRFNIAVGVATALRYLHEECLRPVIHRDVKSSNILLTDDLEPQLSDFGLATWGPSEASFFTDTDVVGTFGYLAPEYLMYGEVSDKVDVYSFGVVLLELLSGRKPIGDEKCKGQESLVIWARPRLEKGDFEGILDEYLGGEINKAEMQRMAFAARLCLTQTARLRPNMCKILKLLTGDQMELMENGIDSVSYEDNGDQVYNPYSYPIAECQLDFALLDLNDKPASISSVV